MERFSTKGEVVTKRQVVLWIGGITLCGGALLLVKSITLPWRVPSVAEEYHLTASQIRDLTRQADTGDGNAALTIGLYYGLSLGDRKNAEVWFLKAKECGLPEADAWLKSVRHKPPALPPPNE
jgi:hypothetical protein